MKTLHLAGVAIQTGKEYVVTHTQDGATHEYQGTFDSWDIGTDRFAFTNDNAEPNILVVSGCNVCSIDLLPNYDTPAGVTDTDPNGIDQHTAGAKLDAGKVMVDAILAGFPRALWGVAEVGTFGANKYSLNGWQAVEDGIRRYRDAAGRHRLKRQKGELIDPDSGLLHSYHEAWNVLAALELERRED